MRHLISLLVVTSLPWLAISSSAEGVPTGSRAVAIHPVGGEYLEPGGSVAWERDAETTSYDVELCGDPQCGRVIERGTGLRTTYWAPTSRKPGTYYWRVRAAGGVFGNTERFTIALTIRGTVSIDAGSLALPQQFQPAEGVTVHLYGEPSQQRLATLKTGADGRWSFHPDQPGSYWIAVDSRSIGHAPSWAEQTWGPEGGICTTLGGNTFTRDMAGPCFGGRFIDRSDDPSALLTSKHVALIKLADVVGEVNFAFSFNVVDALADSPKDDQPLQGSLRQYLQNATSGTASRMRFIPRVQPQKPAIPPAMGIAPRWWTLQLSRPLPAITQAGTIVDGTAYSLASANTPLLTNLGQNGIENLETPRAVGDIARRVNPELEILASGENGIVCEAACTVRNLAISGPATSLVLRADATIKLCIIGRRADMSLVDTHGNTGIQIERGTTKVTDVFVGDLKTAGVITTTRDARLEADRLEITGCGNAQSGGAVVLLSAGSSVIRSLLDQNPGAGVLIGLPSAASTEASGNTIAGCTISGNLFGIVLSPGVMGNIARGNLLLWNRFGGITAAPFVNMPAPERNLLEGNAFDENGGRPITFDLKTPDYEALQGRAGCDRNVAVANGGLHPPEISSVLLDKEKGQQVIRIEGRGCPGTTVWLYQSFATTGVRTRTMAPRVHTVNQNVGENETLVSRTREPLPSIGEFNPAGRRVVSADGRFSFTIPVQPSRRAEDLRGVIDNDFEMRFEDFAVVDPTDTSFSVMATDSEGNSSELGQRHLVSNRSRF